MSNLPTSIAVQLRGAIGLARCVLVSVRIGVSLIAGLMSAAVPYYSGCLDWWPSLFRVTPMVLLCMTGFLLNDIFDRHKDRQAGRQRPIATGLLPTAHAKFTATSLLLIALATEVTFGTWSSFLMIAASSLAVIGYSSFSLRLPLLKGVYTSFLSCFPIVYGTLLAGIELRVFVLLILAIFIIGRELLLDVADMEGDKKFGLRTIPCVVGRGYSVTAGWSLMTIALVLLYFSVVHPMAETLSLLGMIVLVPSMLIFMKNMRTAVGITRLSMILGALAIAISLNTM